MTKMSHRKGDDSFKLLNSDTNVWQATAFTLSTFKPAELSKPQSSVSHPSGQHKTLVESSPLLSS